MKKWEYCMISIQIGTPMNQRLALIFFKPSGEEKENIDSPSVTIANLGRNGWEMISYQKILVVSEQKNALVQDETYIFKRALSE